MSDSESEVDPQTPVDEVFPYPGYRDHQREALESAKEALFESDEYDNVVLFLPVGIGKSGI